MEKKVYRGRLRFGSNGMEDEILVIDTGDVKFDGFLVEVIRTDMCLYGDLLTVRYFITDEECPADKLDEELLKTLLGKGSATYSMGYSEITGYLWTNQNLRVGGHNLLNELWDRVGKWIHMEIEYNKSA